MQVLHNIFLVSVPYAATVSEENLLNTQANTPTLNLLNKQATTMEKFHSKYYMLVVMILVALVSKSHTCEDQRPKVNAITTPCGLSRKTTNVMLGAAPSCAVAIILFIVLFHLCMRHCSSYDHHHTEDNDDIVNREAIDKCPVFDYSTVKVGVDCAVCLGEFEESDTIKMLPKCQHVFHQHCIDTWLPCRMTCPICREKLTIMDVVDT